MKLDFFRDVEKDSKKNVVKELLDEINEALERVSSKKREENLFQVVSGNPEHVYLQNTKTGEIFEEKNLQDEIKNAVSEGFVLKCEKGEYSIDEKLTDNYFENQISVKEYYDIRNKFLNKNKIKEKEKFIVKNIGEKDATLEKEGNKQIRVPKVLLPYFINERQHLIFSKEKFKIDIQKENKIN